MTFSHQPIFEKCDDRTVYRKLTADGIKIENLGGREILTVSESAITLLTDAAFDDVSHLLRTAHLEKLAKILKDPEASKNDRFVAVELLKNSVIAAERIFPSCQDTGTAIVMAKKGENVYTGIDDSIPVSKGIFDAYQRRNLRFSQLAPLSMYEEKNTGTNLPAQIDIYAELGNKYEFLFIAK
ncbi:MAG: fumarate hydratase, partial [Proteobacteria bacterium]|nr:fumarate hydratase [Pseudomonadota bacterium]